MTKKLDFNNPMGYPVRDDFGRGCFYRAIRLERKTDDQGDFIQGELEDCNHGFRVRVYVDKEKVVNIEGSALRTPLTTCYGAIEPLRQLIDCPLGLSAKALSARVNATEHCTHWLDLACLAILHAARDEAVRHYRVAAPDETDGPEWVTVHKNDELMMSWHIHNWIIKAPQSLEGKTLFKGFASWANDEFDDDMREAAFILQKGYFVSTARRFDLDKRAGEPATNHTIMQGACFSYSEPQLSKANRAENSVRDFSDDQSQLLKFQ